MANKTLEQQRAECALAAIESLQKEGYAKYGQYRSEVDALPATILMNGLGQAVAMLMANAGNEEGDGGKEKQVACRLLKAHLEQWLCDKAPHSPYRNVKPLIKAIVERDQDNYVLAQAEALAYLVWLKKFARAFLEKSATKGDHHAEKSA